MPRERWKPVAGLEDCYAVSDRGRVRRMAHFGIWAKRPPTMLRPKVTKGYVSFYLSKDGIGRWHMVHRLMWEAFREPIPAKMQINHLNGKKDDNRLCNLEVCTRSQNMQHAYRVLGIPAPNYPSYGSKNGCAKLTEADIPVIVSLYRTGKHRQKDIGKMFGVSQRMVSLITRREKWQHVPC